MKHSHGQKVMVTTLYDVVEQNIEYIP